MATNANRTVLNGRKGLSALLLALALLVVTAAGAVTAEQATNAQALENEELDELMLNAVYVDADTDLTELDEQTRLALELAEESDDGDGGVLARELSDDWQGVDPLPFWHPNFQHRCGQVITTNSSSEDADIVDCDGPEVTGIVVIIYTDGYVAWVAVVVLFDDGTYDVSRHGPMRLSELRERLADFDGRIIVHWIDFGNDDDVEPACGGGLLAGQYQVSEDGTIGTFRALLMNAEGDTIGTMSGQYQDGQFRGTWIARGGSLSGTVSGTYGNGTFHGLWAATDVDLNGAMRGHYMGISEDQGVFRGQWKVNCNDDIEPVPLPQPMPRLVCKKVIIVTETITGADAEALDFSDAESKTKVKVVCKKVISYGDDIVEVPDDERPRCKAMAAQSDEATDLSQSDMKNCKVVAIPLQPVSVNPSDVNNDKDLDILSISKMKKGTSELLDKQIVETGGGYSVDVGDAAAGGALSSISLLGLGLIRRRFMLL